MTVSSTATDEAAIRTLVEAWMRAVRARDLPGILADHSPDIVMFDLPPPLEARGLEAYRRTWDPFFAWCGRAGRVPQHRDADHRRQRRGVRLGHDALRRHGAER